MDTQKDHNLDKKVIHFSNGNRAILVAPSPHTPAAAILEALDIGSPEALIILVGGATGLDKSMKPRLVRLFRHGIAQTAGDAKALILDGGTLAGAMKMMGQGVAQIKQNTQLLGVAPAGKVTYPGALNRKAINDVALLDPNHSHFVLVESNQWGGETETMYALADELSQEIPVLTILVNGGEGAKHEVLQSMRHGWTIIVIEKTGRLADEITVAIREKKKIAGEEMAAILSYDRLVLFDMDKGPEALYTIIRQKLLQAPAV